MPILSQIYLYFTMKNTAHPRLEPVMAEGVGFTSSPLPLRGIVAQHKLLIPFLFSHDVIIYYSMAEGVGFEPTRPLRA